MYAGGGESSGGGSGGFRPLEEAEPSQMGSRLPFRPRVIRRMCTVVPEMCRSSIPGHYGPIIAHYNGLRHGNIDLHHYHHGEFSGHGYGNHLLAESHACGCAHNYGYAAASYGLHHYASADYMEYPMGAQCGCRGICGGGYPPTVNPVYGAPYSYSRSNSVYAPRSDAGLIQNRPIQPVTTSAGQRGDAARTTPSAFRRYAPAGDSEPNRPTPAFPPNNNGMEAGPGVSSGHSAGCTCGRNIESTPRYGSLSDGFRVRPPVTTAGATYNNDLRPSFS